MAFDAFLQIDSIPGECTDDKHKDWVEIKDYTHNINQPLSGSASSGGGRSSERANHGTFQITKELDAASPKLALFCCNGEHIKKVTLELCRAGGDKQKYIFRIAPLSSWASSMIWKFATTVPGVKKVVILTENTDYGIPAAKETTDGLASAGIEAVTFSVDIGTQDFAGIIERKLEGLEGLG